MEAIAASALSELIGAIYDCALDPERWEPALNKLLGAFDGQTAALGLTDLGRTTALISKIVGMEPHWQRELERHGPEIHRFTSKVFSARQSLDEPFVISRELSAEYCADSPYVQHCLRPQGLVDVIQLMVISTPTRLAGLGIGRRGSQGTITDREIALAKLFLPHVRRAVTISDALDASAIARERMSRAFDAFRCAVVLADARGKILFANKAAEAMLRDGVLVQSSGGILRATEPAAAWELRTAIALAEKTESDLGKIGLSVSLSGDDDVAVLAHVLPLTGSPLRASLRPEAVAAVFINPAKMAIEPALEVVEGLFKLTATELRVLRAIVETGGAPDIAASLGISPATVRSHLKRLFEKTGAHRQADLVKLVADHASSFAWLK